MCQEIPLCRISRTVTRSTFWVEISWPSPVLERLIRNPDFQVSLILLCPASLYGADEPSRLEFCLYCVVRDIGPRHCHLLMEMNPARRIHKSHLTQSSCCHILSSAPRERAAASLSKIAVTCITQCVCHALICNGGFVSNVHLLRNTRFSFRDQSNQRHKY